LDGGAKIHDSIRASPGLFDKILEGLKQIHNFKAKKNTRRPFINLQCTITQYNYRYLEQLVEVATQTNAASLTFHNLIFINREILAKQKIYDEILNSSSADWEGFVFDPGIEPDSLYKKVKQILSLKHSFTVDFYPNLSYKDIQEYYRNPAYVPSVYPYRCLSPWMVAYIFPDGGVRPCLNFSYSYGNIKQHKFSALWNNEQAVRFRSLLRNKHAFAVCARCTELYRY
jgi:radical SAM protein with 4Fe4S-binding SPASM domain